MKRASGLRLSLYWIALFVPGGFSACGPAGGVSESAQTAVNQLSNPNSLDISGPGTGFAGATSYIDASSSGTIDSSENVVTATFSDPFLPLSLSSTSAFSDQMYSGSCSSLGLLLSSVAGTSGNEVITQLSATGCTDLSVITVNLDTTQINDNQGFFGQQVVSFNLTVDLAPKVSVAATGNSAANGTGTTEGSTGVFSISTDRSIVVTFSKSLQNGSFGANLSGCVATLGTPSLVVGTNNEVLEWPMNLNGIVAGNTCALNVSGVSDGAGNFDDPSDPNLSTTVTFH